MTAAERWAAADLRRLARDIEADVAVVDELGAAVASIAQRSGSLGPEGEAFLAVKLHAWYTALESLLERIARIVEGSLPSGPAWHQELLRSATLPLPGVRPPVLRSELLAPLSGILAFRHFLRHAYAVALDEARLRHHAETVAATQPAVRADLRAFGSSLDELIRQIEGGS